MLAILGGAAAAVIWAFGGTCATRASRQVGAPLTLAWVMGSGLVLLAVPLALSQTPRWSPDVVLWLAMSGIGNVVGLLLTYGAVRRGYLGLVAPILSAEGAVTAVIAIAAGESIAIDRVVALVAVTAGVVLTARSGGRPALARGDEARGPGAAGLAVLAAVSFGVALYGTGRAGASVPLTWAVLPPRLVGGLALTLPYAATSSLRLPRSMVPLVLTTGTCEVLGFYSYTLGARHGLAVAAVLASLTGAVAVGMGRLAFGERLRPIQLVGVFVIAAGVATLSALAG